MLKQFSNSAFIYSMFECRDHFYNISTAHNLCLWNAESAKCTVIQHKQTLKKDHSLVKQLFAGWVVAVARSQWAMLWTYSWLSIQGSLLLVLRVLNIVPGLNWNKSCTRQGPKLLHYLYIQQSVLTQPFVFTPAYQHLSFTPAHRLAVTSKAADQWFSPILQLQTSPFKNWLVVENNCFNLYIKLVQENPTNWIILQNRRRKKYSMRLKCTIHIVELLDKLGELQLCCKDPCPF